MGRGFGASPCVFPPFFARTKGLVWGGEEVCLSVGVVDAQFWAVKRECIWEFSRPICTETFEGATGFPRPVNGPWGVTMRLAGGRRVVMWTPNTPFVGAYFGWDFKAIWGCWGYGCITRRLRQGHGEGEEYVGMAARPEVGSGGILVVWERSIGPGGAWSARTPQMVLLNTPPAGGG